METVTKICDYCHEEAEHTKKHLGENNYQLRCRKCGSLYTQVMYTSKELAPTKPAAPNPAELSDEDLVEFAKSHDIPATSRWNRETILDRLNGL